MKQEDSLSIGPCSPSSRLSSTPPSSHCSSRPTSPSVCPSHLNHHHHHPHTPPTTSNTSEPTPSIDFRIPDIETSLIHEEGIDGSEFDQYLPSGGFNSSHGIMHLHHHQQHGKHSQSRDCSGTDLENNNMHNNKNKRYCTSAGAEGASDNYNNYNSGDDVSTMVRYHELQPSEGLVKNERFPSASNVYYQNGMPLNASAGYYSGNGQYLPNYQYLPHQRSVFTNSGTYVVPNATTNDTWTNYAWIKTVPLLLRIEIRLFAEYCKHTILKRTNCKVHWRITTFRCLGEDTSQFGN